MRGENINKMMSLNAVSLCLSLPACQSVKMEMTTYCIWNIPESKHRLSAERAFSTQIFFIISAVYSTLNMLISFLCSEEEEEEVTPALVRC